MSRRQRSVLDAGVSQGTAWEDQWARILRWRERVRFSRDDWRNDGSGTEHYRDEVFALFQALWHLKDWLKNDPALPAPVGVAVETWIVGEGHLLKVAADVANGSKHMTLDRMRAEGSSRQGTRRISGWERPAARVLRGGCQKQ